MLDAKIMTFLRVVSEKSYTRAAQDLGLTQPAVSQQIRKLEEHYGARLIAVTGKGLRMTEQGEALFNYANLQLANEQQLIRQIGKLQSPIRIGATLSIADYYLPDYIAGYLRRFEDPVSVTVKNTENILEMLLKNELDCAFIEGLFDKSLFAHVEFLRTFFVPVARKGHPLAGKTVRVGQVHEYPLILREKGSGTREIYETYLYQLNDSVLSAHSIHEISSFGIIKQILAQSDGISFMYEGVARKEVKEGSLIHLDVEGFNIQRPLYFLYPHHSLSKPVNDDFYEKIMAQASPGR